MQTQPPGPLSDEAKVSARPSPASLARRGGCGPAPHVLTATCSSAPGARAAPFRVMDAARRGARASVSVCRSPRKQHVLFGAPVGVVRLAQAQCSPLTRTAVELEEQMQRTEEAVRAEEAHAGGLLLHLLPHQVRRARVSRQRRGRAGLGQATAHARAPARGASAKRSLDVFHSHVCVCGGGDFASVWTSVCVAPAPEAAGCATWLRPPDRLPTVNALPPPPPPPARRPWGRGCYARWCCRSRPWRGA